MNLFKSSILTAFVFFLLFSSSISFAATISKTPADTTLNTKATPVATVNIGNAKIVSQKGNVFDISFDISNRTTLQTGVKYGVELIQDGSNSIVDEKVYDESLTLYENYTIHKEVTYTAPSNLSGDYSLMLTSNNISGFPFAIAPLGKVKLVATTKGIRILNNTCYLQVEGEKGSPHYAPNKGVDIMATESLRLTCSAVNEDSTPITATPSYETRYFTTYGNIAPQTGGDNSTIIFAGNEKKNISLILPKGNIPQFYNIKFGLVSGDNSSNYITVHYIIDGVNGGIQELSLDKDYYKAGEKGNIALIWSASAGNFPRSGIKNEIPPNVSANIKITDKNSVECANTINQSLKPDFKSPQTMISFNAKRTCVDPHVSVSLTDDKGNILDQKDFNFTSNPQTTHEESKGNKSALFIVIALLAMIALVAYIIRRKNNSGIQ